MSLKPRIKKTTSFLCNLSLFLYICPPSNKGVPSLTEGKAEIIPSNLMQIMLP